MRMASASSLPPRRRIIPHRPREKRGSVWNNSLFLGGNKTRKNTTKPEKPRKTQKNKNQKKHKTKKHQARKKENTNKNQAIARLMALIDFNLGFSLFREIEKSKISLSEKVETESRVSQFLGVMAIFTLKSVRESTSFLSVFHLKMSNGLRKCLRPCRIRRLRSRRCPRFVNS